MPLRPCHGHVPLSSSVGTVDPDRKARPIAGGPVVTADADQTLVAMMDPANREWVPLVSTHSDELVKHATHIAQVTGRSVRILRFSECKEFAFIEAVVEGSP